ncbi:hypothetical protein NBO_28g0009 [Nosema bombycis CQ1]|uniref:Uncharacterized protein n=1 Tax=Nosema bombycis (strain CQ1 / CVCC 102059) TaxID=578461 RepID=R0MJK1_NOSB1|nr:hypothetical protein NBO_28g0009 [Nosema bombycis CQ1]|eukprot:EOB14370.1 hypothetical protein NBO_28g0009 [Nosema bombycis CQ1]
MISAMSVNNDCELKTKQNSHKMTFVRLVKAYMFMMFNEYFIIKNGVYCSESCESLIKKILDKSNQTEEREEFFNDNREEVINDNREEVFNDNREEFFNDNREELNVIGQEGSEEQIEISVRFYEIEFLPPSAADPEDVRKSKMIYSLLTSYFLNLDLFQEKTAPNLKKNIKEIKNLLITFENILKENKKYKPKTASFVSKCFRPKPAKRKFYWLENIEQFYEEKKTFYAAVDFKIIKNLIEAVQLARQFNDFRCEFNTSLSLKLHPDPEDLTKRFNESKIDKAATVLLEEINGLKKVIKEDKTQIDKILSVLSKFNSKTLEELEAVVKFDEPPYN